MTRALVAFAMTAALAAASCNRADHGHDHGPRASGPPAESGEHDHDHDHDEHPLGTIAIGDLEVTLAQAHGAVEAGKEAHLVVKLPYSDRGATTVRAWLGTEDRTRSLVGRGEYAADHDDYDIHATAPDPLPANVHWWIEIERPDGTRLLGSAEPRLE